MSANLSQKEDAMNVPAGGEGETPLVFVVPAFRDSPHLDACLWSLRQQTLPCHVVIVTSTPSAHIEATAAKHGVPVLVNPQGGSIAADWNFALKQGGGGLVTLAHQDDLYTEKYAESCVRIWESHPDVLAVFTDYAEILGEGGIIRGNTTMLKIKRLLLLPYMLKTTIASRFVKKAVLRLGSPICCPSVCLNMDALKGFQFDEAFSVNMDWDAWLRLAERPGPMAYVRERYCFHRIHADSETSSSLHDNRRADEDLRIFQRLWPKPVAGLIAKAYSLSYRSNDLAKSKGGTGRRVKDGIVVAEEEGDPI